MVDRRRRALDDAHVEDLLQALGGRIGADVGGAGAASCSVKVKTFLPTGRSGLGLNSRSAKPSSKLNALGSVVSVMSQ